MVLPPPKYSDQYIWSDNGPNIQTAALRLLSALCPMRRFPPPWTVEALDGCSLSGFKVIDANGQSLAYVYWRETKDAANIAGVGYA